MKGMQLYSAILSELVGCLLAGIFLGKWADQKLNTEPLCLITGLLIGLAAGVFAIIQTLKKYEE